MNSPNLTIGQLEHLIELYGRKQALLTELSDLDGEISGAYSGEPVRGRVGRPKGSAKPAAGRRGRHGGLKERILAKLESVGLGGIKVRDLADQIGVNRKNVEIWFYTSGKKIKSIKKLGPGLFAITGAPRAAVAAPAPGPGRRKRSRAAAGSTREKVLAALREAGKEGITIKELSTKLGIKNQNLHTWFNQTGKKLAEITKIGTGRYQYSA